MKNQDYNKLIYYLRRQCWQQADIETRRLMLKIAEVENREEILLTKSDIQNFPCNSLKAIDKLWLKASKNHFGFSIIHHIYHEVECDYFRLAEVVGWKKGDHWIRIEDIDFTSNAPKGHLPLTWLIPTTFSMYWSSRFASAGWGLLLQRWGNCPDDKEFDRVVPVITSVHKST